MWAFQVGRFESHGAIRYENLTRIAGIHHSHPQVKIEDFQRLFHCEAPIVRSCSLPPCFCTSPPCDLCSSQQRLIKAADVTEVLPPLLLHAPPKLPKDTTQIASPELPNDTKQIAPPELPKDTKQTAPPQHPIDTKEVAPPEIPIDTIDADQEPAEFVMGVNQVEEPQVDEHTRHMLLQAGYSASEIAMLFSVSVSNHETGLPPSPELGQQQMQQRQPQGQKQQEQQQHSHQEQQEDVLEKWQEQEQQIQPLHVQRSAAGEAEVQVGEAAVHVGVRSLDEEQRLLKGISYSPIPFKRQQWVPSEDFMSDRAERFWGPLPTGRGDLGVIRSLGANAVRVHGVDPYLWHGRFLDEAKRQGLQVMVGMSDYPFFQMPGNCVDTNFDCFSQIRSDFRAALGSGYVTKGSYHSALAVLVIADEPDIKMVQGSEERARRESYCRGIVSAVDALLDAEREAGVTQGLPKLTAAFSFTRCGSDCGQHGSIPGLGQMAALHHAFLHPQDIGYSPRNNVTRVYLDRFVHGLNAGRATTSEVEEFRVAYDSHFSVPCLFTEGGSEPRQMLQLIQTPGTMLRGAVLADFQTRHDHVGAEGQSSLFNLGQRDLGRVDFFGTQTPLWCLEPAHGRPAELAAALGGDSKVVNAQCGNGHLEI